MGLLRDERYWANVLNEMWKHRPLPKRPMPSENAIAILAIACRALTELVKDDEFEADIASAIDLAMQAKEERNSALPEFGGFVDGFIRAERDVVMQAGVDMEVTLDILNEVSELARDMEAGDERFDRLGEKIAYCAKLACEGHDHIDLADEDTSIWSDVWRATKGVALIGINAGGAAGAAAAFPPAGAVAAGMVLGLSISYGADAIKKSIKRRW